VHKFAEGDRVVIADRPEVYRFAGRVGVIYGFTKPSKSKEGPIHGSSPDDFAWSVYFADTREQEWFHHYLLAPAD
jgi:hypothetical protein